MMASSSTIRSPLLALPLELRMKIFEQLLSPDPDHVYPLYHDRLGRDAFASKQSYQELFSGLIDRGVDGTSQPLKQGPELDHQAPDTLSHIDPRILRVNRQIYAEASPLLYHNNTYLLYLATGVIQQCTGGSYCDGIPSPPSLFCVDLNNDFERSSNEEMLTLRGGFRRSKPLGDGIIYPHIFQRLRQINIVVSGGAVWGSCDGGTFFSHIGKTIWKILQFMANDKTNGKKRLRLTVNHWWGDSTGADGRDRLARRLRPIFGMMKALQRKVAVTIEVEAEGKLQPLNQYIAMCDSEVGQWEKPLLADMQGLSDYIKRYEQKNPPFSNRK